MVLRQLAATLVAVLALQGQPTIRSGVELIRVDVSVVDATGQPVADLRPGDFTVRIDAAPRAVSFATFYGTRKREVAAPTAIATAVTNAATDRGRAIVFAVDLESLIAGYEKAAVDAAASLVDALGPSDLAGVLGIPGSSLELTTDRPRVKAALESLRGLSPQSRQRHALSMFEAEAFAKRDTRTITQVTQRECPPQDRAVNCQTEVIEDAKLLLFEANRRTRIVTEVMTALHERL